QPPCLGSTAGVMRQLASSRWFDGRSGVSNLAPRQDWNGTIQLFRSSTYARLPGLVSIDLQYWIADPNGSMTIVRRSPDGTEHDATLAPVSFASVEDGAPVSFASDIRPLFRPVDIDHMAEILVLNDYQSVKDSACGIFDAVANPDNPYPMPPDAAGRWSEDKIA